MREVKAFGGGVETAVVDRDSEVVKRVAEGLAKPRVLRALNPGAQSVHVIFLSIFSLE